MGFSPFFLDLSRDEFFLLRKAAFETSILILFCRFSLSSAPLSSFPARLLSARVFPEEDMGFVGGATFHQLASSLFLVSCIGDSPPLRRSQEVVQMELRGVRFLRPPFATFSSGATFFCVGPLFVPDPEEGLLS